MTREDLEHAIRAACDLAQDTEVIVFGSQAILGQYPDAPDTLRQSAEVDVAPRHSIDKVDLIDAMLGEDSTFHRTHGFYVHGVPIETAVLPNGWERRAVKVQNTKTRQFIGWCVEAHDLAASKRVAFEIRIAISSAFCLLSGLSSLGSFLFASASFRATRASVVARYNGWSGL